MGKALAKEPRAGSAIGKLPPPKPGALSSCTINSDTLSLSVDVMRSSSDDVLVQIAAAEPVQGDGEPLCLHWGVVLRAGDDRSKFIRPADALFPPGTDPRPGEPSVQTPFVNGSLEFCIPQKHLPAGIVFLAFIKDEAPFRRQWFKDSHGGSFFIDLSPAMTDAERARRADAVAEEARRAEEAERLALERRAKERAAREEAALKEREMRAVRDKDAAAYLAGEAAGWSLFKACNNQYEFGSLFMHALVQEADLDDEDAERKPGHAVVACTIASGGADVYLHWGLKMAGKSGWIAPAPEYWPDDTRIAPDGKAVQTLLPGIASSGCRGLHITRFPDDAVGIFAVVHVPEGDDHIKWIQGQTGGDIVLDLTPPPPLPGFKKGEEVSSACKEILQGIIEREMEYGSWTLMHRYSYAHDLINGVVAEDTDAWSALYVWMRYSQIRVLDWQRHFNTKPRELSHAQLRVVTLLANRFRIPSVRWLVRLVMGCIGRGGSGDLGQRIRDDILVILRHHRGWGHGSMMEQWHQKLHNNTSPDDVVICDALMEYWRNDGDLGAYWRVIGASGLTRERMASYEQPITVDPDFHGHIKDTMLWELGRYGSLLKAVHLGTDFHSIVDWCQGFLDGDAKAQVAGYMHARSADGPITDVLRAVAHARQSLFNQLTFGEMSDENRRDLVFLDVALESDARRCVESVDGLGHDGTLWSHLTAVRAAAASLKCSEGGLKTEGELERAMHDVRAVVDRVGRQGESHDVGLRAAAALNILRNVLTEIVDRYKDRLGPLAQCLGTAFGADKTIVNTFIEEAVRGGPAFVLSHLIRKAQPAVRRVADLSPFSTIAPHDEESKGPVLVFNKLRETIGLNFKPGTVVISDSCDGDEDVPANTAYVVIGSTVDVLSHVAVRARNEHHGLVACLDADKLVELRQLHGCIVKAKLMGDDFHIDVLDDSGRMSPSQGVKNHIKRVRSSGIITPPSGLMTPPGLFSLKRWGSKNRLVDALRSPGAQALVRKASNTSLKLLGSERPELSERQKAIDERQLAAPWAIRPSAFNDELVGSKSLNLQRLVALGLPDWIKTPVSVAVPNGAMRKVMYDDENAELLKEYQELLAQIRTAKPGDIRLCIKIREVIMCLEAPDGLQEALRGVLDDLGCEDIDAALPGAWEAVKGVWASVWNERAHLARLKLRLDVDDVAMAVLCQKVVDADYAFVIHTTNPISGDANEIYAEAVIGLGETLVGNAPGQALGFTVKKDADMDTVVPTVRSYPSKGTALIGGEYIFRSDSNAEDLEGFAGAGLHDSIPIVKNEIVDIEYSNEQIMTDDNFRNDFMRKIAKIGKEVENVMGGSPQDIEGCYKNGEFYVVQVRPQV